MSQDSEERVLQKRSSRSNISGSLKFCAIYTEGQLLEQTPVDDTGVIPPYFLTPDLSTPQLVETKETPQKEVKKLPPTEGEKYFLAGEDIYHKREGNKGLVKAAGWYRKSAMEGYPLGQVAYGRCLLRGEGVKKDLHQGFRWSLKAAQQGNGEGQNQVGECYFHGFGVKQSKGKGFAWFLKSARNGCADGQINLAYCYRTGQGASRSIDKSVEWYKKAFDQGRREIECFLDATYEEHQPQQKPKEKPKDHTKSGRKVEVIIDPEEFLEVIEELPGYISEEDPSPSTPSEIFPVNELPGYIEEKEVESFLELDQELPGFFEEAT